LIDQKNHDKADFCGKLITIILTRQVKIWEKNYNSELEKYVI